MTSPRRRWMQRRRLRRVHGPARRRTGERVHDAVGRLAGRRWRRSRDCTRAASAAACRGVLDARRRAMRHLHARHAGVGRSAAAGTPAPTEQQVMDGLGGVLCRCTGYPQDHRGRDERRRGRGRRNAAPGRQGRGAARAARRRPAQGGRHGRLRRRRIADGALVIRSSARRTTEPASGSATWRIRRRIAGSRRRHDRVQHPRPERVRCDPATAISRCSPNPTTGCDSEVRRSP